MLSKIEFESTGAQNVENFQNLVVKKKVPKQMGIKLGNLGLCLKHIQLAYLCGGAQWLSCRMLDLRPKGRRFQTHWRHSVVVHKQDTFFSHLCPCKIGCQLM